MSGAKHTQYARKLVSSDGIRAPLLIGGGSGVPVGGAGPLAHLETYSTIGAAAKTLAPEECGGTHHSTGAGTTTFPTAVVLNAAWPDLPVGAFTELLVYSQTGARTLAVGAGVTLVGTAAVAAGTTRIVRLLKNSGTTWLALGHV